MLAHGHANAVAGLVGRVADLTRDLHQLGDLGIRGGEPWPNTIPSWFAPSTGVWRAVWVARREQRSAFPSEHCTRRACRLIPWLAAETLPGYDGE